MHVKVASFVYVLLSQGILNFNENICRYIIVHFINFVKVLHPANFFLSSILSIFFNNCNNLTWLGFFFIILNVNYPLFSAFIVSYSHLSWVAKQLQVMLNILGCISAEKIRGWVGGCWWRKVVKEWWWRRRVSKESLVNFYL